MRRLNLFHKGFIWLAAPILFQVVMFCGYARITKNISAAEHKQYVSRMLIGQTNWLTTLMVSDVFSVFAYCETGDPQNLKEHQASQGKVTKLLAELATTCSANQTELDQISSLKKDWDTIGELCTRALAQKEQGNAKAALQSISGDEYRRAWSGLIMHRRNILAADRDQFVEDAKNIAWIDRLKPDQLLELALIGNIGFALLLLLGFSRQIVGRLNVLTDNATKLALGWELNPIMPGSDEITDLDKTFHQMAAALREARHRENAIIQNAVDVICTIDKNGIITSVSASCEKAWGCKVEELIGMKLVDLLAVNSRVSTLKLFQQAIQDNSPFSFENELQHPDGRTLFLHWTGCWSAEENQLFCVARDITEQRHLEELKQQFIGMISHDLRTPLTSLGGFLELAKDGVFGHDEKLLRGAGISKRSVDRLIGLVNDLLDLEKLQHGLVPLTLRTIRLDRLFSESMATVKNLADAKQIEVVSEDCTMELEIDVDRIGQVLVNLLSNAIKFSSPGQRVSLSCSESDEAVIISVSDEGRGIPPEQQSKLFERFHQVETADGQRGVGTGLGLSICKALVEQHRGRIGVESNVNKGSRFWFELPKTDRVSKIRLDQVDKVELKTKL